MPAKPTPSDSATGESTAWRPTFDMAPFTHGKLATCQPGGVGCEDVPLMMDEPQTLWPTVLAHGMGGFDEFGPLEYWVGVEEALWEAGYPVYTAVVDPLNGSDVRAEQLREFVDHVRACTCAQKVNIIGHSQGGIDARVLVNAMGYGPWVGSVSTIATPHRGSIVADQLLGIMPIQAEGLIDMLGWLVSEIYTDPIEEVSVKKALLWVSQTHLTQFAKDYPDDPEVTWYSYAGRAGITSDGKPECEDAALPNPKLKAPMNAPLLAGWTVLGGFEGIDNDGLVTVESARWGVFRGCVPADHIQEIGMFIGTPKLFDHLAFFEDHMAFLSNEGF